jgi:hypothetical protein
MQRKRQTKDVIFFIGVPPEFIFLAVRYFYIISMQRYIVNKIAELK